MNVLGMVTDPVAILDRKGDIQFANPALLEFFNVQSDQAFTGPIHQFLSTDSWEHLSEHGFATVEDTAPWAARLEIVCGDGKARRVDVRLFRLDRASGYRGDFALTIGSAISTHTAPQGEHSPQRNYKVRTQRQQVPMVMLLNEKGRVIDVNRVGQKCIGINKSDLLGRLFWDLPVWAGNQEFESNSRHNIQAALLGRVERALASLTDLHGRQIWTELSFAPVSNSNGPTRNILVEGRDVTSRIEAEISQRQYTMRLGHLSRELLRTQENERRQIAQELHDEIGQSLTALRLSLHTVRDSQADKKMEERVSAGMQVVDQVLQQIRNLSLNLRPAMLDDMGLAAALGWFVARQAELTGIDILLESDLTDVRWRRSIEVACYRIAQEAVSNAMRYSGTDRIHINLVLNHFHLELTVRDFGKGFRTKDALASAASGKSLGLVNMQQRTELLNGEFNVESSPGNGTTIFVRIPVEQEVQLLEGQL